MKKLLLIAILGIGLTSLISCKKDYICTCVSSDPNGLVTETTKTNISASSESRAIDDCEELNAVNNNITTYCVLD
mgnify:CR=1 FL=1